MENAPIEHQPSLAQRCSSRRSDTEPKAFPQATVKRPGCPGWPTGNPESRFRHLKCHSRRRQRTPAQLAPDCTTRHPAGGIRHGRTPQAGFLISQSSLLVTFEGGREVLAGATLKRKVWRLALFRFGNWHENTVHSTTIGKELGIEDRHIDDSSVAAISRVATLRAAQPRIHL